MSPITATNKPGLIGAKQMQEVPLALKNAANERVLTYLQDLSAHGDIAELLLTAVEPLGDVQTFCPDPSSYRYVLVSTNGIAFGFAAGMHTLAVRLDPRMKARALATGGIAWTECGEDWAAVMHRRPDDDWPKVDVAFWARKAYVHARTLRP